eukprot:TRINITY_DN61206_c0_g1_i1.p1 TRINITY_DN61206_c0_g1~~TRINITY_DN61206_c0_g1_i1.p1  ORF type:complete len:219 (-),score=44.78 TRINITY_DN61206_c0_g1_i1:104-760(-)
MAGSTTAILATVGIICLMIFMWLATPTEQTLAPTFPNVVILRGMGSDKLDPISFDNNTLPEISAAEAANFNGFYQFDPLFYHKSFDRFVPWEERGKAMVFECSMGCSPHNTSAKDVKLALVHASFDGKRYLWHLVEFRDEDANSPILYARTKFRKAPTYRVPWVTVTPGGDVKPRDLEEVHIITAWDALRFDTPLKWAITVAIVGGIVLWCKTKEKDD